MSCRCIVERFVSPHDVFLFTGSIERRFICYWMEISVRQHRSALTEWPWRCRKSCRRCHCLNQPVVDNFGYTLQEYWFGRRWIDGRSVTSVWDGFSWTVGRQRQVLRRTQTDFTTQDEEKLGENWNNEQQVMMAGMFIAAAAQIHVRMAQPTREDASGEINSQNFLCKP